MHVVGLFRVTKGEEGGKQGWFGWTKEKWAREGSGKREVNREHKRDRRVSLGWAIRGISVDLLVGIR